MYCKTAAIYKYLANIYYISFVKASFYLWLCGVFTVFAGGTGSYPEPPQGWQRRILLHPSHNPFMIPWVCSASIIYCEQDG